MSAITNALDIYKSTIESSALYVAAFRYHSAYYVDRDPAKQAISGKAFNVAKAAIQTATNTLAFYSKSPDAATVASINSAIELYKSKINNAPFAKEAAAFYSAASAQAKTTNDKYAAIDLSAAITAAGAALSKAKEVVNSQSAAAAAAPKVPAGLTKEFLKANIKKIYGPNIKTADDAFRQWNNSFVDYLKNANSNGFKPSAFSINLAVGFKKSADAKSFVDDFDKNIEDWLNGITWSDGKDTKKATTSGPLGFKTFSKQHENDTDVDKYQEALAAVLHNWFSKIKV
jgi:uncharacterized protein YfiM (DUF2279 family)